MLALVAAGCGSQPDTSQEQKIAELEQQLQDVKGQLAESQEKAVPEAPAQPEAPAPSAEKPQQAPAPAAKAPDAVTKEEYAADKAAARAAVDRQQAINAGQAATNADVQRQIEELKPLEITLPVGTVIAVLNTSELSTKTLSNGSVFDAILDRDLVGDGTVLARKGARVTGVVVSSDPGGKVKGVASLDVAVQSIVGPKGTSIAVRTDSFAAQAEQSKGKDAKRTGILTGAGAAIGAIAGGGKGAAIGAGAGAATGVGATLATRGEAAVIPAETLMEFRLTAPVTVVVPR
jgi:hypothetical protein